MDDDGSVKSSGDTFGLILATPKLTSDFERLVEDLERGSVKLSKAARLRLEHAVSDDNLGAVGDNLLSYKDVLLSNRCTTSSYIDAVHFITHKLSGLDSLESYQLVFSSKAREFRSSGVTESELRRKANVYNSSRIVAKVAEVSLVPSYILNNHLFQEALNTQVMIMRNDEASFKVRSDAASEVLKHTQIPETLFNNKEELSEQVSDVIGLLSKAANSMASAINNNIKRGGDLRDIAESKIYDDVEIIDEDS